MPNHVHRDLDVLQRPAECFGEFLELPGLDQLQVIGDDLPGHAPLPLRLSICSSRHSRRSRAPTPAGSSVCTTSALPARRPGRMALGSAISSSVRGQIAVFIQVADDALGGVAHVFRQHGDTQLRMQMIGRA